MSACFSMYGSYTVILKYKLDWAGPHSSSKLKFSNSQNLKKIGPCPYFDLSWVDQTWLYLSLLDLTWPDLTCPGLT